MAAAPPIHWPAATTRLFCSDSTVQKPKKNNVERAVTLAPGHVAFVALGYILLCIAPTPFLGTIEKRNRMWLDVMPGKPIGLFYDSFGLFLTPVPTALAGGAPRFQGIGQNYNHDCMAGFNGKGVFFYYSVL
jgi:hypothetical protein